MFEDGQQVRTQLGCVGVSHRGCTKRMKKGMVCVRFDGPPVFLNGVLDAPFKAFNHYPETTLEVVV